VKHEVVRDKDFEFSERVRVSRLSSTPSPRGWLPRWTEEAHARRAAFEAVDPPVVLGDLHADPAAYTDEGRLHEALTLLRRQAPVHRVEADGYGPRGC
jgi:hypothetical protein